MNRSLPLLLAAAALAMPLAACGSSAHSGGTTNESNIGLELARCMRSHGAPNVPDPSAGGGLEITPASGINPQSPSFQSAQLACRRYLPSKAGPPVMSAAVRQRAFAFARCVRAHGQADFPDPTIGAPTPTTTGRVLVMRGMFFAVSPNFDPKAPAFRQAAAACGLTVLR